MTQTEFKTHVLTRVKEARALLRLASLELKRNGCAEVRHPLFSIHGFITADEKVVAETEEYCHDVVETLPPSEVAGVAPVLSHTESSAQATPVQIPEVKK